MFDIDERETFVRMFVLTTLLNIGTLYYGNIIIKYFVLLINIRCVPIYIVHNVNEKIRTYLQLSKIGT